MKLHQLRYFVSVATQGSVRAAAAAMGVSAASVSQALRELEAAMATPLIKREPHGTVPTYAGRQLLVHARLALGQLARAEEEIAQIRGLAGGTLCFGITPWISQSILPHALARFHTLRPDVRIDVTEALGSAHPRLRDGTLDLVIGVPPRHAQSGFFARDLFRCGLAVVARLGHPLARCTSLRDLGDQDWVLTLREEGGEQPLAELLGPHEVAPAPERIHFARSALLAIGMLEVGDMLTICPWPLVETPLFRDRVQALPIREPLPDMPTSLLVRRSGTLSTAGQLFIDCFREATEVCANLDDLVLKRIMNSVELLPQN